MNEKIIINKKSKIIDAWRQIGENAKGFVFVVEEDGKLCAVITDGDIRRFLLAGGSLNDPIFKAASVNFVYARSGDSFEKIMSLLSKKIKFIPIVDEQFKLVNYFEFDSNYYVPVTQPDLIGNELKYVIDAILSTWVSSTGHYITRFENDFARYCGTKYGLAVSNGTAALHLALRTIGIGKGDEVIVPDLTFAATINAVFHSGATPVIVDVDMDSWCIDPNEIKKAITLRTKAIIPVHLYGQPCDMDSIMDIAKKHQIFIIEDAAESHGAEFDGKKTGSFGTIGCFSFFGNKVITTGEGGMCLTNDESLLTKMRIYRDHGMSKTKKYWHDMIGFNYRMTNIQASLGVAQLERIDKILEEKQKIEDFYRKELSDIKEITFQRNDLLKRKKITWLVTILVKKDRDGLIQRLRTQGIDTRPVFYPLSAMPIYRNFVFSNHNSVKISEIGINLPTGKMIDIDIIKKIKKICKMHFSH